MFYAFPVGSSAFDAHASALNDWLVTALAAEAGSYSHLTMFSYFLGVHAVCLHSRRAAR